MFLDRRGSDMYEFTAIYITFISKPVMDLINVLRTHLLAFKPLITGRTPVITISM